MIITMVVAGLWHGAAWNFVIWGLLHALGRTVTRELEQTGFYAERLPKFIKQFFIFHYVCITWIFFRAETFGKAVLILRGIVSSAWADPRFPVAGILAVLAVWAYQYIFESRLGWTLQHSAVKVSLMAGMILYMIFFRTSGYEIFLYFRF